MPGAMQTILHVLAKYAVIVSLPGLVIYSLLGGISRMLAVLAIVCAWLLAGAGIAWAIGRATDLGATSEEWE